MSASKRGDLRPSSASVEYVIVWDGRRDGSDRGYLNQPAHPTRPAPALPRAPREWVTLDATLEAQAYLRTTWATMQDLCDRLRCRQRKVHTILTQLRARGLLRQISTKEGRIGRLICRYHVVEEDP